MAWVRSDRLLFGLLAVVGAFFIVRGLAAQPGGFTDVFYHFNAANHLASGQGFTDEYLWVYVGMPEGLPAPSHLYWMPLTSLLAAVGMGLLNAPGDYAAAQLPFVLMLAGTAYVGFWLGGRLGGTRRHAWLAGLITLFGGYYMRFWGATDTFTPYALIGSLCLVCMGLYADRDSERGYWYAAFAGVLAGLAHLTRADGVLLLMVGWVVVLWPTLSPSTDGVGRAAPLRGKLTALAIMTLVYLMVMLPWFLRNLAAMGSPLPVGGAQGIWFTEYNDLFNYPPDASPQTFFAEGVGRLLATRWEALVNNLGTFIAVEGMIILVPLMLIGLWARRDGFLRGFWLYALGLHLVMTLVFPFAGYRGGLFHSAAALLPWWAALALVGLDDVVEWIAKRRRTWRASTAKWLFSLALLGFVIFLSLSIALPRRIEAHTPALYSALDAALPVDARVMVNDPAQLYYFTGRGGVVLPNELPEVIAQIADKYGVDYLLLEYTTSEGQTLVAAPSSLASILDTPPDFLTRVDVDLPGAVLYAIDS